MNYTGWLQIVLSYNIKDSMDIRVEDSFELSEEKILSVLTEHSPEINETITDKTGIVRIIKQKKDEFELSTGGGKVKSVIDVRKKA